MQKSARQLVVGLEDRNRILSRMSGHLERDAMVADWGSRKRTCIPTPPTGSPSFRRDPQCADSRTPGLLCQEKGGQREQCFLKINDGSRIGWQYLSCSIILFHDTTAERLNSSTEFHDEAINTSVVKHIVSSELPGSSPIFMFKDEIYRCSHRGRVYLCGTLVNSQFLCQNSCHSSQPNLTELKP